MLYLLKPKKSREANDARLNKHRSLQVPTQAPQTEVVLQEEPMTGANLKSFSKRLMEPSIVYYVVQQFISKKMQPIFFF